MTKEQLISQLAETAGLKKADCIAVLDAQEVIVHKAIAAGDDLTIPGICKVSVTLKAARTGRNPKTGEALAIAEHKSPKFKALKALKDAVH